MPVPTTDVLDGFNWCKFTVVDIDVMSDSHKRLVNICYWEYFEAMLLHICFVQLSNLFV